MEWHMKKKIAGVTMALIATAAMANPNWVAFAHNSISHETELYDAGSVKSDSGHVVIWVRDELGAPKQSDGVLYDAHEEHLDIDCGKNNQITVLSYAAFLHGKTVKYGDSKLSYDPLPDSPAMTAANKFCPKDN
jgi:hypothetical protein